MLNKSNSALMQQRLSKWAKYFKTTSFQLAPDAGDLAVERLSPTSSARPHTSTVTFQLFTLPSYSTGNFWEIDGQGYSAF